MNPSMRPAPPAPVDVVTAREAAELFASTERRLADLEAERADAEGAAAEAEQRLRAEPIDPDLHTWAAEKLERFIRELRAEHEEEVRALLADATARARDCVDRAHREADVILSYARAIKAVRTADEQARRAPEPASPPPPEAGVPGPADPDADPSRPVAAAIAPVQVLTTPESGAPVLQPPLVGEPKAPEHAVPAVDDPAPTAPTSTIAAPPPAPALPTTSDPKPAPAEGAVTPPAAGHLAATQAEDTTGGGGVGGSEGGGEGGGANPGDGDAEFWPAEPQPKLRRFFHRLPRLAILQVLAVVIILVVVLLRLG